MTTGVGNNILSLHIFGNLAKKMEAETEVVTNRDRIFELFKKTYFHIVWILELSVVKFLSNVNCHI